MPDPAKTLMAAILEHVRSLALAFASLSVIATAAWWLAGPRIEQTARDLVGTSELRDLVIQQGARLQETKDAVTDISNRVRALEPSPAVSEYDVLRSSIDAQCGRGQICRYTYRVRRTDQGTSCGAPTAQRVLVDSSGTTFFPQAGNSDLSAQRLSEEWAVVALSFVVPWRAATGVAEFSLQLTYPDCDAAELGRAVVLEESPHLIFEIVEHPQ